LVAEQESDDEDQEDMEALKKKLMKKGKGKAKAKPPSQGEKIKEIKFHNSIFVSSLLVYSGSHF